MRKLIMTAVAVASLAIPTAAMAETGHASHLKLGNATNSIQGYSASYTDSYFGGPINCFGLHVVKGGAAQDDFTCTLAKGGSWANVPTNGYSEEWASDFDQVNGSPVETGTMKIVGLTHDLHGNVTSFTSVATY